MVTTCHAQVIMNARSLAAVIGKFILLGIGLVGCSRASASEIATPVIFVPLETAAMTEQADPTPETIVAQVNGEPILLAEYEMHLQKVNLNSGQSLAESQRILEGLIDQRLIEQAAQEQGIVVSDHALENELRDMTAGYTGEALQLWLKMNQLSDAEFKQMLHSQLVARALYEHIIDQTPQMLPQVHARQILIADAETAQTILDQLQMGESFIELAVAYSEDEASRIYGGDLGWFPKGIQTLPTPVEAVVFSLDSGEVSPVLASELGYHIVKIERNDAERPLTPEQRQTLQKRAFQEWLTRQRGSAQIDRYLN
jgi:parvulin-like peptidyl-prolyl isomerase